MLLKRVKYKYSDVLASVKSLKAAKDSDDQTNTLYGTMSDDIRFKGDRNKECFLADTGANLNIVGLEVARDNNLCITKLKAPKQIVDASGNLLDIVGVCSFYFKIDIFAGRIKKISQARIWTAPFLLFLFVFLYMESIKVSFFLLGHLNFVGLGRFHFFA